MEILIKIADILISGILLTFPVFILIILKRLKTKRTIIFYSIISLIVLGVIIVFFAWWSYKSDLILLKHFGYNIDGMNHTELYGNVSPHNLHKVKHLENNVMGIGWPLKAVFGYLLFIPYLILVYIGNIILRRVKMNKNKAWK